MKSSRIGSLYVLQDSIVTGSNAIYSSLSNSDVTKLWNTRLGHMSEKEMHLLSKQGSFGKHGMGKLEFCDHCIFGKDGGYAN
jgi:hypothetical protein